MSTEERPIPTLDPIQARVLGCLVEKEATTPDTYPLTVNAAQAAANQKTAREPVMALEMCQVHHALRQLETAGLVRQQFSSRAERYEHRLEPVLGLTRQQAVLLALLCLRGAQTVHELFGRSERMLRFNDAEEVRHALERLAQRALVVVLPRGSGQREDRYAHLLCGAVEVPAPAQTGNSEVAEPGLRARVEALEAQVAELRAQLARLLPHASDAIAP